MTEKARILAAARQRGSTGICQPEFLAPDVIDGGKPITRLAARINDLKKDGYRFVDGGKRASCKVYVLAQDTASSPPAPTPTGAPAPVPPSSAYPPPPAGGTGGHPLTTTSEPAAPGASLGDGGHLFDPDLGAAPPPSAYDLDEAA